MRLLHFRDDGTLTCTEFGRHNIPRYAILSHTWGDEEVTLQDLFHSTATDLAGYQKIMFCGEQAAKDGLKYFWVDTCCIDKHNLPELSKAINSMFRWYQNASKCYAYLSDVSVPSKDGTTVDPDIWMQAFRQSRWFTRGWTLQELIAPVSVDFFSAEGYLLGDKQSLESEINEVTDVPLEAIRGQSLDNFSASERFSWAESRETTEEEDIAYCLLGIFNVFMPLIYGEGETNALKRLERLVNESLNDNILGGTEDIDNKADGDEPSGDDPIGGRASDPKLAAGDAEGRKRRKDYVLNALGSSRKLQLRPRLRHRAMPIILNPWHRAICLSRDVAHGANAGSIFQDSHVFFLNAVYWDEWPKFESIVDRVELMADIRGHCDNAEHSSRLLVACNSIEAFALRWEHFFTVVEFAIDIDPEWPSTVWGAIRLVFVRCKNFVTIFEKLAKMLDKMRRHLPSYHDHALRLHNDCPEALKSHLGKVLAFVYADILQFCHDACMFLRLSPGEPRIAPEVVNILLSTPFSTRFEDLIQRLSAHKGLFDVDLRAGRHGSLESFVRNVMQSLIDREQFMQETSVKQYLEVEKSSHDRTFHETIRNWIQPPEFKSDFSKAKSARGQGSCTWLQSTPAYASWKTELRDSASELEYNGKSKAEPGPPILWLKGPPGYGKTILSTAIIDDLTNVTSNSPVAKNRRLRDEVAYFYFNAQMPGKQSYRDALRAMAIQIIESLQADDELIDVVSILMNNEDDRRYMASDEDLMELLLLAVRRCSSLALVLDGIDECQDFEKMWQFLSTACADRRIRCLVLGRLMVTVPSEYAHLVIHQYLLNMNRQDIWNYLIREIRKLQMTGMLPRHLISDRIADTLTLRADSRFLWATLMISYLQSPALSPTEREHEIKHSDRLETLHGMYSGMLRQFDSLFSPERALLTKILQFLVLSKEPPSIEQLNIAISAKPGRKLSKTDRIQNVADTLHRLCGGLIDIGSDSTVLFSHLSFRVFLLSEAATQARAPFRVDSKAGSLRIAVVCLSYIVNDIPQGPLSGLPDTEADKNEIAMQLPLSAYSARYWVDHAVSALQLMPNTLHGLISEAYPLLQQLGAFLSRKASISAWIEVCWMCKVQPSIEALWQELEKRLVQVRGGVQRNSIEWGTSESLGQVRTLSENLQKLNEHWSHLLSVRPYEIWGASISAFLGPSSWAHNSEADVTIIANNDTYEDIEETVLKVSKLSACGKYLGIITLSRPSGQRNPNAVAPCVCGIQICSCGGNRSLVNLENATACYQILEIKPGFPIAKFFPIELNKEDLREVERTSEGRNFRFPVAFAPNLRCISILRTLFWEGQDGTLQQQRLDEAPPKLIPKHSPNPLLKAIKNHVPIIVPEPPSSKSGRRRWFQRLRKQKENSIEMKPPRRVHTVIVEQPQQKVAIRSKFYKPKFSHCGRYVAIVERQDDMNESSEGRWTFIIWKRESSDNSPAEDVTWQRIALLSDVYGDFLSDGNFAFNPQFQSIAILECAQYTSYQTSVWNFGVSTNGKRKTTMVYGSGLRNLHFSPDGLCLFGDHFHYGTVRVVPLKSYLTDAVPVPTPIEDLVNDSGFSDVKSESGSEDGWMQVVKATSSQLIPNTLTQRSIQSSNTLTLAAPNGIPELSTIRSYNDGAVVLKRLSPFDEEEKCLLYLPNRMDTYTSVNILDNAQQNPEHVRIALVPDFQDAYTWDNPLNRQSATIITRSIESIQQYKLPNGQHRIAYEVGELSSLPNAGAARLLTLYEGDYNGDDDDDDDDDNDIL